MDAKKIVNEKTIEANVEETEREYFLGLQNTEVSFLPEYSHKIPLLMSASELESLVKSLSNVDWTPVGVNGMKGNYSPGDPVGSWRVSCFDEKLSEALWERVKLVIDTDRVFDEHANTDWDGKEKWRAIGINPLMRYIKYTDDGMLVPHYDAPYVEDDNKRTLQTLVIYIENEDIEGGSTRFLHDKQAHKPFNERKHHDWGREPKEHEIQSSITPETGTGLIFDHRILHDSEKTHGSGHKIILRTDILFEKI